MSLSDLSFKLYDDDAGTSPFPGNISFTHFTSLSDGDQDFQVWLMSTMPEDLRVLQATSNPGIDNITITPTSTTPIFPLSTAVTLGQQYRPISANTYVYQVTTAGTTDSSSPTWPTTPVGATITSGTAVFTLLGKEHPTTEIKLALTAGGLDSATAGAALSLGTAIYSGVDNAIEINVRVTNTVTDVINDTAYPQLGLYINTVKETSV